MPILKKQTVDQDVLTLALDRIRHIYDLFDHVAVSFSGGKDSTVVFNLALQVARERGRTPLRVFHFDEEAIPADVEDYLRRMAQIPDVKIEWYCVPIKHRNACDPKHPYWYTWAEESRDLWCRPMPPEAITQIPGYDATNPKNRRTIPEISSLLFPPELGRCCMLLGIRADESMTRYMAVSHREDENYIVSHGSGFGGTNFVKFPHVFKGYPIYDWSTSDVWTAPSALGWDYCRFYDLLEMSKISHSQQRLAPPFGEEPFKALSMYAKAYPELWTKMVYRVPGANTAALYSRTDLYGFGELPDKPDDVSWPDFLAIQIRKHAPVLQKKTSERIKKELTAHYRKTNGDPLMDDTPHPITGIDWKFLLAIAVRTDSKNRRFAFTNLNRSADKYEAARAAAEAGLSEDGTRY